MSRAERLLDLIQILRRHRQLPFDDADDPRAINRQSGILHQHAHRKTQIVKECFEHGQASSFAIGFLGLRDAADHRAERLAQARLL